MRTQAKIGKALKIKLIQSECAKFLKKKVKLCENSQKGIFTSRKCRLCNKGTWDISVLILKTLNSVGIFKIILEKMYYSNFFFLKDMITPV